jgi:hypothetical protein
VKKKTSYEGMFFGMIVLAWAILAVVFNVLHHELPAAKNTGAKPAQAHVVAPAANADR